MQVETTSTRSYQRRNPRETELYKAVQLWWPQFRALCASDGRGLPSCVSDEFEAYLRCGCLEFGFSRRVCDACGHSEFLPFSCKQRGFCPSCCGRRSAQVQARLVDDFLPRVPYRQWVVTLPIPLRYRCARNLPMQNEIHRLITDTISSWYTGRGSADLGERKTGFASFLQRFGSSLNLNPHFHLLFIDGFYFRAATGRLRFMAGKLPTDAEVTQVLERIRAAVISYLQGKGLVNSRQEWEIDEEDPLAEESPALAQAMNGSIQNLIVFGKGAGTRMEKIGGPVSGCWQDQPLPRGPRCAELNGFSLHADRGVKASRRKELEKLIGYMSRPPLAANHLMLKEDGKYFLLLKRPFRDGTRGVQFTGLELMSRLAALIPPTGQHLFRYGGVLGSHDSWRPEVALVPEMPAPEPGDPSETSCPKSRLLWADLLQRSLGLDPNRCLLCGGNLRLVAVIKDLQEVHRILTHTGLATGPPPPPPRDYQLHLEFLPDSCWDAP